MARKNCSKIKPVITLFSIWRNRYYAKCFTFQVHVGATHDQEMCNLYVMYYLEDGTAMGVDCPNEQNPGITQLLPADSDSPLPPNPDLELKAKSGHASSSAAVDKASKHKTVGKKVLNPVEEGKNALFDYLILILNWSGSFP